MRGAALIAVVTAALTGCQRAEDPPPRVKQARTQRAAAARPATRAPAKRPPLKAPATVNDKRLGKLPKGVGLPVGSQVADMAVKTHLGEPVQLVDLVKTGPLILIFYRGGW